MNKIAIALIMLLALAGCQSSDQEIRADIASKAQQDLNFSGLQYTVKNGIANFTGRCPSEKALAKIRQTISNIHVLKEVHYRVAIAPVALDTLTPVKVQVDSILAQYPQVTADISATGVTLKGEVLAKERPKLIKALQLPNIGPVKDSMAVSNN